MMVWAEWRVSRAWWVRDESREEGGRLWGESSRGEGER